MIQLGPKETEIIARLSYEKATVITKDQLEKLFGGMVLVRQIIYQFKKKGILKSITRGVYYYCPLESGPAGVQINEFLIPPILFPKGNYYIGYSNMYNYHGFTDQIFQTLYVLNTSLQRERVICNIPFKLLKIPGNRMYGLETIRIQKMEIVVSDRERTLVDMIHYSHPVGGLEQAFKILEAQVGSSTIDVDRFIHYALLFPNLSVRKRIGFVLDGCGIGQTSLERLEKSVHDSSPITLYGSKSRRGDINSKWRVIVDAS